MDKKAPPVKSPFIIIRCYFTGGLFPDFGYVYTSIPKYIWVFLNYISMLKKIQYIYIEKEINFGKKI
jgi:hypothetical protein